MKSIQEIRLEFEKADDDRLAELFLVYGEDKRSGVVSLLRRYRRIQTMREAEETRLRIMSRFEEEYRNYKLICGIDEVGRGPLAGPVYAGAVILPRGCHILYINDSKKLSPERREALSAEIYEKAVAVGIGSVSSRRIDEIKILQATYEAMRTAVRNLGIMPDILLNDAVTIPGISVRQVPIIRGDASSISIAAASIVAKVARDHRMEEYDREIPGYGFAANKGYGTADHIEALKRLGPSPIHRRTFIGHFIDGGTCDGK